MAAWGAVGWGVARGVPGRGHARTHVHTHTRETPTRPPRPRQVVDVLKRGAGHEPLLCTAACILGEYGRLAEVGARGVVGGHWGCWGPRARAGKLRPGVA